MNAPAPSLFRRLLSSFAALLLLAWLGLCALTVWSAVRRYEQVVGNDLRASAEDILAGAIELADRPEAIRRVAAGIENNENATMPTAGRPANRFHVQVWQGQAVIYASQSLPAIRPLQAGAVALPSPAGVDWIAFTAEQSPGGLAVRYGIEHPRGFTFQPDSLGYMLLPLVFSLPLLLLPAWLLTRAALRPLHALSNDIAERDEAQLEALPPGRYRYRELQPIVTAINGLLGRLSARLAAEQAFLSDAAHELKTPLAVIQANAEALAGDLGADRQREARAGLRAGIDRAVHALHQLLALGRTSADRATRSPEPCALAAFVRERLAYHAARALARGIELEFDARADGGVMLDPEAAAALLDNLLDNAIKFSPAGAPVRVDLQRVAGRLLLVIEDRGPGIPVELRQQVFQRFYRIAGRDQPGSGLGLAIVERAVRRLGAELSLADGSDGVGLRVELAFPEVRAEAPGHG